MKRGASRPTQLPGLGLHAVFALQQLPCSRWFRPHRPGRHKGCRDRALDHPLGAGAPLRVTQLLGHSVQDWWGSALSTWRLGCSSEVTSGMAPSPCSLPETLHRLSRFQLLSPCPLGWKPHDQGRGHLGPSVGLSRRLEQCEHVCRPACLRTDAGSAPTHPMMCCT